MAKRGEKAPAISEATILEVYVAAAGHCSFYGCPEGVMFESLTHKKARLGNIAHIVGDSRRGPRGDHTLSMKKRSEPENLMLMCTKHHALIDKKKHAPDFPVDLLREWKQKHEERMALLTSIPATARTHALRLLGKVRGNLTKMSDAEVYPAVFTHEKRYTDQHVIDIDLGKMEDAGDKNYWNAGTAKIKAVLQEQILPRIERGDIERLSVFSLARIPLLCFFGYHLGDKVPISLYQKHRDDGEGWIWPKDGAEVKFKISQHGKPDGERISLLASISGGEVEKVEKSMGGGVIYQIEPIDATPSRTLLRSPKTLENFRQTFQEFLSLLEARHRKVKKVHFFLAVPAPVAVICGRELLRDVAPKVVIHDLVNGEYQPTITLN